jgi:hypothetical protein
MVLLMPVLLVAGCTGSGGAEPDAAAAVASSSTALDPSASTEVALTVDASSPSAGTIAVMGSATVPDGAHVNWAVSPDSLPAHCPVDVAPEDDPCNAPYGFTTVTGEAFEFRVEGVVPGGAELFVGFDPLAAPPQPAVVPELYGIRGQRMTGDQVVDDGAGAFRAQVIKRVDVEG